MSVIEVEDIVIGYWEGNTHLRKETCLPTTAEERNCFFACTVPESHPLREHLDSQLQHLQIFLAPSNRKRAPKKAIIPLYWSWSWKKKPPCAGRTLQKSLEEPMLVEGVLVLSLMAMGAPTQGRVTSIHWYSCSLCSCPKEKK